MKLPALVKTLDQMSDEELQERLRQIRHNRETVRPAAKKHVERSEAKTSRKRVSKVEDMLDALSPEDRAELIKQLEG